MVFPDGGLNGFANEHVLIFTFALKLILVLIFICIPPFLFMFILAFVFLKINVESNDLKNSAVPKSVLLVLILSSHVQSCPIMSSYVPNLDRD